MRIAITGASSGIGAALACQLAARGAGVAVCARRLGPLEDLAGRFPAIYPFACDVADPAACARFVLDASDALGGLDTLVCNAGYGLSATIAETTPAQWQAILATNLLGTTACMQAAIPIMRAQALREGWRGQLVVVASALSRRARPDSGAYSATKAAQLAVAEAARVELAGERIAVTSVHPVGTATAFMDVASTRGAPWRRRAHEPMQTAEQVAAAITRAIVRPRPEVWPHRLARWLLLLAAAWPRLADRALARARA